MGYIPNTIQNSNGKITKLVLKLIGYDKNSYIQNLKSQLSSITIKKFTK